MTPIEPDASTSTAPLGDGPQRSGDLTNAGDELAVKTQVLLRLSSILLIVALWALQDDRGSAAVIVIGALACGAVILVSRPILRALSPTVRPGASAVSCAVDLAFMLVACRETGGPDSPVLWFLPVTALVAHNLLSPVGTLVLSPLVVGGAFLAGLDGPHLPAYIGVATWAVLYSLASGRGLRRRRERLARLDRLHQSLVLQRPLHTLRRRLAGELREVHAHLPEAPSGGGTHDADAYVALRDAMRRTSGRVRAMTQELDAGVAGARDLGDGCRAIAARYAADGAIAVAVPEAVEPVVTAPLIVALRGALRVAAGPSPGRIDVRVEALERGMRMRVVVEHGAGPGSDGGAAAWTHFKGRCTAKGIDASLRGVPDGVEITLRMNEVRAVATSAVDVRERLPMIVLRGGFPFIAAVLLLSGPTPSTAFVVWAGVLVAWAVVSIPVILRTQWVTLAPGVAVIDVTLILATYGAAGPVGPSIVPIGALCLAATPLLYDRTRAVLVAVAAVVATWLIGTTASPESQLVFVWAIGVGIADQVLRLRMRRIDRDALAERTARLRDLAAEEESGRRAAANDLHDDLLQVLLVALQDIGEAIDDEPGAREQVPDSVALAGEALDRTVERLETATPLGAWRTASRAGTANGVGAPTVVS